MNSSTDTQPSVQPNSQAITTTSNQLHNQPANQTAKQSDDARIRYTVLIVFVSFFLFSFIAWYESSRVIRVQLPSIDQPINQSGQTIKQSLDQLSKRAFPIHVHADGVNVQSTKHVIDQAILAVQSLSPYQLLPIILSSTQAINQSSDVAIPPLELAIKQSDQSIDWHLSDGVLTRHIGDCSTDRAGDCALDYLVDELIAMLQAVLAVHHSNNEPLDRTSYQISLTLLTAQPQPYLVDWLIDEVVDPFDSLIEHLEPVLNLTVDSQVRAYGNIAPVVYQFNQTNKQSNSNRVVHYVTLDDLANFLGRTEWNIESPFSLSSLELLVYIPPSNQIPLYVGTHQSISQSSDQLDDSFIVPGWGAVCILNGYNPDHSAAQSVNSFANVIPLSSQSTDELIARLIGQMRSLLGLTDSLLNDDGSVLTEWEINALVQRYIDIHSKHALKTLTALYELIESTPHMPVQQHIADMFSTVIEHMQTAYDHCLHGQWKECARHCREASYWSEKAFYDPTMLPMLHFPAEHMYAVYAPFFAPIILPVLSAVIKTVKEFRKRKVKES